MESSDYLCKHISHVYVGSVNAQQDSISVQTWEFIKISIVSHFTRAHTGFERIFAHVCAGATYGINWQVLRHDDCTHIFIAKMFGHRLVSRRSRVDDINVSLATLTHTGTIAFHSRLHPSTSPFVRSGRGSVHNIHTHTHTSNVKRRVSIKPVCVHLYTLFVRSLIARFAWQYLVWFA